MNFLSESIKNERKKATEELLAENKGITIWDAASRLKGHKSFRGSVSGINNYLRFNLADLFILRKIDPDRRKKAVERLIAEKTGITIWRAAKELAGHDDFSRNVQSVSQYIRKNFSELFMDTTVGGRKKRLAKERKQAIPSQSKEVEMPKESDEMGMLLGTYKLLLNVSTIGSDELTTMRVLFGLIQQRYKPVTQRCAMSAEEDDRIRASARRDERNDFGVMYRLVEDALKKHKISIFKSDNTHFIRVMINSYSNHEDMEEIGNRICAAISNQAQRVNGSR